MALQAAVSLLSHPAPPQPSTAALALIRVASGHDKLLFTEPSSASQELNLRCARQSKQIVAATRTPDPARSAQKRDERYHVVLAPFSLGVRLSFPRNLSPPLGSVLSA